MPTYRQRRLCRPQYAAIEAGSIFADSKVDPVKPTHVPSLVCAGGTRPADLKKRGTSLNNIANEDFIFSDSVEDEILSQGAGLQVHRISLLPKLIVIAQVHTYCSTESAVVGLRDLIALQALPEDLDRTIDTAPPDG